MNAPGRLLGRHEAAGYLGVSVGTIDYCMRHRKLPFVRIRKSPKFLLSDLDRVILEDRISETAWNSDAQEVPRPVVAKLLNISLNSVTRLVMTAKVKDLTPESVREYLRKQMLHEARKKVRREIRSKLNHLKKENSRRAKQFKEIQARKTERCHFCGRAPIRPCNRIGAYQKRKARKLEEQSVA